MKSLSTPVGNLLAGLTLFSAAIFAGHFGNGHSVAELVAAPAFPPIVAAIVSCGVMFALGSRFVATLAVVVTVTCFAGLMVGMRGADTLNSLVYAGVAGLFVGGIAFAVEARLKRRHVA